MEEKRGYEKIFMKWRESLDIDIMSSIRNGRSGRLAKVR